METTTKCLVTQEALKGKLKEIIGSRSKTSLPDAIRWSHCIVREMGICEINHLANAVVDLLFSTTKRELIVHWGLENLNVKYNLNSIFTANFKLEDGMYYYTVDFTEKSLRISAQKKGGNGQVQLSLWIPYRDRYKTLEELKFFSPLIFRLKKWIDVQDVFGD